MITLSLFTFPVFDAAAPVASSPAECILPAMAGNLQRSTSGRLLIVWAVLLTCLVIFAWRVRLHADEYTSMEWTSGLGDHDYYTRLSADDRYNAALVFPAEPNGVYRRQIKPVRRDDARMNRIARDAGNHVYVYTDPRNAEVYYLKVADDQYVQFGKRRFWPEYKPEIKAIPVGNATKVK